MTDPLALLTFLPVLGICWLLWTDPDQPEPEGEDEIEELYTDIGGEG